RFAGSPPFAWLASLRSLASSLVAAGSLRCARSQLSGSLAANCEPPTPNLQYPTSAPRASDDLLAERRRGEFPAEDRRRVAGVENRVHFDDVQRAEAARVGDHLHHHVRLAVVEASLDRRAHAGRNRRIADVEIEGQMDAARAAAGNRDRLFDDERNARAVDVLHREDVDARLADPFLFAFSEVPNAAEDGPLGGH